MSKKKVSMRTARADFGKPIDGFFKKQPPHLRAILVELRRLVEGTVPTATASLKWGMPCYTLSGRMMCMLGGHKSHVNLVLAGPADAFADPEDRLQGGSQGGRHLKLESVADLPRASVQRWLKAAARHARAKENPSASKSAATRKSPTGSRSRRRSGSSPSTARRTGR